MKSKEIASKKIKAEAEKIFDKKGFGLFKFTGKIFFLNECFICESTRQMNIIITLSSRLVLPMFVHGFSVFGGWKWNTYKTSVPVCYECFKHPVPKKYLKIVRIESKIKSESPDVIFSTTLKSFYIKMCTLEGVEIVSPPRLGFILH
nr:hypothetical protein [Bacteroidota bacterium]